MRCLRPRILPSSHSRFIILLAAFDLAPNSPGIQIAKEKEKRSRLVWFGYKLGLCASLRLKLPLRGWAGDIMVCSRNSVIEVVVVSMWIMKVSEG
jgi:hypothetical protein